MDFQPPASHDRHSPARAPLLLPEIVIARFTLLLALLGTLALTGAGASALQAQTVLGRIVDANGQPVAVALLTLLDDQDLTVRSGLTTATGEFSLGTGRAGTFRLRVERIGLATHTTAAFDLVAGEVLDLPIALSQAPIQLTELRAESTSRCVVRPEDGSSIATLWEEARKGLGITAAVEAGGVVRLTGVHYVRELDGLGRSQTAVHSRRSFASTRTPFDAIPAAMLAGDGFARVEADGALVYYGPSAAVLLSETFLDQHCFNRVLELPDDPGRIGLGFEPVRGTTTVGIAGTMWLDRETGEVRAVEYEYRDPNRRVPDGGHGRVEFERLPNGAPIVSLWWIRMPSALELPAVGVVGSIRVASLHEEGGIVLDAGGLPVGSGGGVLAELDAALAAAGPSTGREITLGTVRQSGGVTIVDTSTSPGGVLSRTVLDELHARRAGMEHAVALLSQSLRVQRGVFRAYDHEAEEIVCVELPDAPAAADVPAAGAAPFCRMIAVYLDGEPAEAPGRLLAAASPADFGMVELLESHAILMLTSRSAPLSGGTPGAVDIHADRAAAPDADQGAIPDADRGAATPAGDRDADDDALLDALDTALADIVARATLTQETLVSGSVIDGTVGTPVVGATVVLQGERSRYSARTDQDGLFTLAGIDEGSYALTVRHLAFPEVADSIQVGGGGRVTRVEVALQREVVTLSPIVATVDRRPTFGVLAPVYDRIEMQRNLGLGRIWERSELDESGAFAISDLLRTLPGVSVVSDDIVLNPANPTCTGGGLSSVRRAPVLFLDGLKFELAGESLSSFLSLSQIELIEVYRRASEVPGEFGGSDAACGVIAVWTRRGR